MTRADVILRPLHVLQLCNRKFDANTQLLLMTAGLFASALNKNVTWVDESAHEKFALVKKSLVLKFPHFLAQVTEHIYCMAFQTFLLLITN